MAPPKKNISDFPALTNFVPSRSDGWHFTTNEVVGRAACVHLTPESEPPRGADCIRRRRGRKKPTHTVVIEAAFREPDGTRDIQYWARLQSDPTRSIIFTTPKLAVDAIHAQEALRASNRKTRSQHRARYASGTPLESLEPTPGDFADHTGRSPQWYNSLGVFDSLTQGCPSTVIKAGFVIDNRKIPTKASPSFRRALQCVTECLLSDHQFGFKLFELFNAMILAPVPQDSDFGTVIRERSAKVLAGDWKPLVLGIRYRKPGHKSQSARPGDPEDEIALQAQYHITKNGSVSSASRALRSPIAPAPTTRGALTNYRAKV